MKRLKKVLAVLICAAIVFSLAGCGEDNGDSNLIVSSPSAKATNAPVDEPTKAPTAEPTAKEDPTEAPIEDPTEKPTEDSTEEPTKVPTAEPTATKAPTAKPTATPATQKTNINLSSLPDSISFPEAGYTDAILRIEEHTGVYIGTCNLSKCTKIVVSYGADANANISIHNIYLKDVDGNVISSAKLTNSNGAGWASGVRNVELTVNSSYSGNLYLMKDEPGHQIAISAIAVYGSGVAVSTPAPTQIPQGNYSNLVNKILQEAQAVTDFARVQNFKYGHASINPGYNWAELNVNKAIDPNERIVSCDRLVDWVLFRTGFIQQPYTHGKVVSQQVEWLESLGFEKITNVSKLQAGDIVFVIDDPTRPGNPAHVFICASNNLGGNVYLRYDHGSNARIQCVTGTEVTKGKQPFKEVITDFFYAYRPTTRYLLDATETNNLVKSPSTTAAIPSATTSVHNAGAFNADGGWGTTAPNYRYKPGSGYNQFEFHVTGLKITSRSEENVWNNCYVGARLPSTDQDPTSYGGVWVGFAAGNSAYLYAGINPNVNNWNQIPLAEFSLPESMTSAHTIIVTDNGEVIRYYMVKTNGTRYLICSIKFNDAIDMMAVFDSNNKLKYLGKSQINSDNSGYFKIWAHNAVSLASKAEIKAK